MQEKFLAFRSAHNFPDKEKRVLLTVSGGIDSVVMAHLYHKAGYSCVVAHCNFQLRGGASDQDEQFVEKLAAHYQFHFHSMKFDIANFAKDNSVSIQEAARKLRYEWFSEICETSGCEAIATAHHANDVAETLIFNLVRGAGFAGMHGIPVKNGKIIRPILFAEKMKLNNMPKLISCNGAKMLLILTMIIQGIKSGIISFPC
ncbi:MAG: tRNA lysidine(34) synthetase TilS [Bacteroidetes bacterium]|nr:tRNA lysidine(34) synthetase TilS [Bacteroidota bacterium]